MIREAAQRIVERACWEATRHVKTEGARESNGRLQPYWFCEWDGEPWPCPERQAWLDTARDAQSILDGIAKVREHAERAWQGSSNPDEDPMWALDLVMCAAEAILELLGDEHPCGRPVPDCTPETCGSGHTCGASQSVLGEPDAQGQSNL